MEWSWFYSDNEMPMTMSPEETKEAYGFFSSFTRDEKAQKTFVQQWKTSWMSLIEPRTTWSLYSSSVGLTCRISLYHWNEDEHMLDEEKSSLVLRIDWLESGTVSSRCTERADIASWRSARRICRQWWPRIDHGCEWAMLVRRHHRHRIFSGQTGRESRQSVTLPKTET